MSTKKLAARNAKRDRRERIGQSLGKAFAARGYVRIDPPLLQPADIFLDLLGDALKIGTYVFTDPGGTELCLRPDFTIAACRHFIAGNPAFKGQARLWYEGAIYRYARDEPVEVRHAGIEFLGGTDREAADVEVLRATLDALRAAGAGETQLRLGDLSLFSALVEAIDLPAPLRDRLRRNFARPDVFKRLLEQLSNGPRSSAGERARLAALRKLEPHEIVAKVLGAHKIGPTGGRSIEEVADRYLERLEEALALPLDPRKKALIEAFQKIKGRPQRALRDLDAFAKRESLDLAQALERLERRFALMAKAKIDLSNAVFATSFGRRIGYYTGFIFGIEGAKGRKTAQLASGGRYDSLMRALGGARDSPAVGAAIFCDNLNHEERAS